MLYNKMSFQPGTTPILTIINDIKNINRGGLDMQPSYQRGYIWKKEYQDKLIYSLFNSYPIGSIVLRVLDSPNQKGAKKEVVDGQQRLTTINNFVNDEVILDSNISKKIIDISLEYFEEASKENKKVSRILEKYKLGKNLKLKFSDFPESLKGNIWAVNIATITISNSTEEQVSEYFRFVQNQERLRAGEIIQSFPDTPLEKYIRKLNNKDLLLKVIGFDDDRKEFEKIFYGMIGLFDGKLNLGSTDNLIKEYVSNKSDELKGDSLELVNNMIRNLNKITFISINNSLKTNKRFLKFILLLSAFQFIDFSSEEIIFVNIKKLNEINNKLSAFNSAKEKVIEDTFGDIIIAEKYRPMSLIVKGAHNFNKVKEVMNSLGNIIKTL